MTKPITLRELMIRNPSKGNLNTSKKNYSLLDSTIRMMNEYLLTHFNNETMYAVLPYNTMRQIKMYNIDGIFMKELAEAFQQNGLIIQFNDARQHYIIYASGHRPDYLLMNLPKPKQKWWNQF